MRFLFMFVEILTLIDAIREMPVCTSIQGPRCSLFSKSEEKTDSAKDLYEDSSAQPWSERLVNMVQKHLRKGLGGSRVSGAFEVIGNLPDGQGHFYLQPTRWLRQPEGWITVGLRGSFEDNMTISGEITDDQGEVLDACSRFALQRKIDPNLSTNAEIEEQQIYKLAGNWHGVYICAGTPTRLSLTIESDHEHFAAQVHGIFDFAVLNNLNSFELEELTKLISESLSDIGADLDLDSADVQLFVVDTDTGDLKPIDDDSFDELLSTPEYILEDEDQEESSPPASQPPIGSPRPHHRHKDHQDTFEDQDDEDGSSSSTTSATTQAQQPRRIGREDDL